MSARGGAKGYIDRTSNRLIIYRQLHHPNPYPNKQTQTTIMSAPGQNGAPQQDALDKAVQYGEKKAGHEQSASTTEKISDGIRTGL